MPRRMNSFSRALKDANQRLIKSEAEREKCQQRMVELNAEIPRLQSIIASLSGKEARVAPERAGLPIQPPPPNIPAELAKYVGPQDLSGLGSIPPEHPAPPTKIETEDDTLAEPEGEELSE